MLALKKEHALAARSGRPEKIPPNPGSIKPDAFKPGLWKSRSGLRVPYGLRNLEDFKIRSIIAAGTLRSQEAHRHVCTPAIAGGPF